MRHYHDGKFDTLSKDVSYLCLSANVHEPSLFGDTTVIAVFFKPENGIIKEDPKCDFAYGIGFIGPDNEADFIEFGDNYYALSVEQYMKGKQNLDSIFRERIKHSECINNDLLSIIKKVDNSRQD